jgi:ABC-type polysaccharide/polyol phosphate transport system ATPase subunit
MSQPIIKVENLSKIYRLGEIGTGSIGQDVDRWFKTKVLRKEDPFLRIGEINDRLISGNSDIVYSLQDINFEIKKGEAVGIIGRNGAGKSTLLKILSRVTTPSAGKINIKGRVASLLEVGTGFHQELTGRENIFLNGAILGMRKREIDRKLEEIIEFSGVERYIDTPVKRYSSGMYVRLAFAVAAHLESEILIVDEVLAVGDAEFQKKCLGKMGEVSKGEGRTVLFVSHNMAAVRSLCNRGIMLENGMIKHNDNVSDVIHLFNSSISNIENRVVFENILSKAVCLKSISINEGKLDLESPKNRILEIELNIFENRDCFYSVEFLLRDASNYPIAFIPLGFTTKKLVQSKANSIKKLTFEVKLPFLAMGEYRVDCMLVDPNVKFYHYLESVKTLAITSAIYPETGWNFKQQTNQGSILCIPKLKEEEYLS